MSDLQSGSTDLFLPRRIRGRWNQNEGDDVFHPLNKAYKAKEFHYKPLKKNLIFKPHNYLIPRPIRKKIQSSRSSDSYLSTKSTISAKVTKSPDEQFEDLLQKIDFKKSDFYPPPQLTQPALTNPPYAYGDGHKYYRQRASTSYNSQFKTPTDTQMAISYKPYFLTRDPVEDIPYDFSTFKRTAFPHIHYHQKKGIFPFVYGPPLPDVRVLQSEYNLRFKNHFKFVKTPAKKVIPENTTKFLQYLT